jgi:hypothetical protein
MAGNPWKVMDILEGLHQEKHPKMFNAFELQSTKIGE